VITEQPESEYPDLLEYNGKDIKIYKDKTKWRKWQTKIYDKLIDETGEFKKPDARKIISLVDFKEASGKSSFFKWLYVQHPKDIGRMGYGSSSQLRSSIINIGRKKLYIVDLPRTKGRGDKQEDLLSIIEDIKTGLVINARYGSVKTLLMEPPHIIISSSYELEYSALSKDKWEVYQIDTKTLDLKDLKISPPI